MTKISLEFQVPESDTERIDWIGKDLSRLRDILGHIENGGFNVRQAIDRLAMLQAVDEEVAIEAGVKELEKASAPPGRVATAFDEG
jgi:hypothetical protein